MYFKDPQFQVVGFDSVDDESKADVTLLNSDTPTPDNWGGSKNPPYRSYIIRTLLTGLIS